MSKNIVYMINLVEDAKLDRTRPYEFSIKSWQHYCTAYDCELYVLEDRIYEETYMNANFHKLFPFYNLLFTKGEDDKGSIMRLVRTWQQDKFAHLRYAKR